MTTPSTLTATQIEILKVAAYRPDGNIEPLSPTLRGGARSKVINGLLTRALIVKEGEAYRLTDAGYVAVGRKRPAPAQEAYPGIEAALTAAEARWKGEKQASAKRLVKVGIEGKPRSRENSKQAQVIAMLKHPEGATIAQICAATGWLAHTVRGAFAGAFKKKLALNILSSKAAGQDRVYRIV